ncbi:MAG: ribonuclease R [Bacteroidales bacterium]|nr:ribonuclease R [Bacteroidales bacterium]
MSKKNNTYPKNALAGVILSIFAENPFKAYNYKQIGHLIGIKDKAGRDLLHQMLDSLLEANDLQVVKTGKYILNPERLQALANKKQFITGKVDLKKTGKAYVISDEGGDDIFIASNNAGHALHEDRVKVFIFPKRKNHKTEGEIVEIISRTKDTYVGVLELNKSFGFVIADSQNMPYDIFIQPQHLNQAKNGEKVLVRIVDWPDHANNPFGEIVEVLGMPGNNDVEMKSILADNNFPLSFSPEVEREAAGIETTVGKEELRQRKDFRDTFTLTIDPYDAKDFDDAVSLKKLDDETWEVGVHIADVSHFVQPGSLLDKEAFQRGTSIYLVDRVIPMLPEKLSNNVCSLRPDEEKLTFSAVFKMNRKAEVTDRWFGKTIIKSDRRFTYEEAQEIIETNKGDFNEEIQVLHALATLLRKKRFNNGSINFHSEEIKFRLDETGKPIETYIKEQKEANHLIEEFMLLANKHVAEFIGKPEPGKKLKTFVYRIHDEPNPEKLNTFVQFLKKLGYSLNVSSRESLAASYNSLFEKIHGRGEETMIETIAVRTMAKAEYSTENIGHYGLAFPFYSHFTSPIRRYPDLMVHRLLQRYLEGGSSANREVYEEMCKHSSEMERRAVQAERDSVKYKQVEFMLDKQGKVFDGNISGVSKWGIFVELAISKSEGLIRFTDLDDDFYYLDEDNYRIIGRKGGKMYRLGDEVKVLVKNVNLEQRKLDFQLIE